MQTETQGTEISHSYVTKHLKICKPSNHTEVETFNMLFNFCIIPLIYQIVHSKYALFVCNYTLIT